MKSFIADHHPAICDYGSEPFIFDINHAANKNPNFRTTLWTGNHLQLTLMSIPVCGDIGVESHTRVDQFLCVVSGKAKVFMGDCKNNLNQQTCVEENCAILIPAGTWHNIVNTGSTPLKLYSLYAPPQHPKNTIHPTKESSEEKPAIPAFGCF